MTSLETQQLSLIAGQRQLIADLNWAVKQGEFWCVLGKNGAGKSSLLHALAGLSNTYNGQVMIADQPLHQIAPNQLAKLRGLMLQQQSDAFAHTVFDAVALGRTPYRFDAGWDSQSDVAMVSAALEQMGLSDRMDDSVMQLSGGERQRVAFAALLAQDPQVMLLDEPTSHQDVAQQLMLMRALQMLSQSHAVIASCHDIQLAARFATHVLLLGADRHWLGKASEVLTLDALEQAYGCRFQQQASGFIAC